jgi:hypothetical protein
VGIDSTSAIEGDVSFTVEGSIDIASLLTRSDIINRTDIITRTDISNPVNIPISDISTATTEGKSTSRKQTTVEDISTEEFVVLLMATVENDGDTITSQNINNADGSYSIELTDIEVAGSTLSLDVYLIVEGNTDLAKRQSADETYETIYLATVQDEDGNTEIAISDVGNGDTLDFGITSSNTDETLVTDANFNSIEELTTSASEDTVSDEEIAASLMLHLPLEECSGTIVDDASNSALTPIVNGKPIWEEKDENDPSDLGDCHLSFDGVDDLIGITTTTDFQEVAWDKGFFAARVNVATPPTSPATIMQMWGFDADWEDGGGWFWFGLFPGPKLRLYVRFIADPNAPSSMIESSEPIAIGEWVELGGSYDGTAAQNLQLYVNGVADTEAVCSNCDIDGDLSVSNVFTVGGGYDRDNEIDSFYFEGAIDNIRVYNEAWTLEDLARD